MEKDDKPVFSNVNPRRWREEYRCCIPACQFYTYAARFKLCKEHYKQYKTQIKEPWLVFLCRERDKHHYYEMVVKQRLESLEDLIERGVLDADALVPFVSPSKPSSKRRVKTRIVTEVEHG